MLSIEFGGGFVYLSSTLRAQAHERGAGGRADPPPLFMESKVRAADATPPVEGAIGF